jgi:2Fe-2S ferredoxin
VTEELPPFSPPAIQVTFLPLNITVKAHRGDTILDAALENGIQMEHECGGNCTCTTCHVTVEEGDYNLSPMQQPEDERLSTTDARRENSRLGCQALLRNGPVVVTVRGDTQPDE